MHKQAGRRLPARETFFVISIINNSGRKKSRQRTKKMEAFVTTGLVLKETRYKESDRILTILTPELGVISAAAQSSLRLKSKLFSACGLFCYSEFTLVPGRNMYTVREAEVKNVFHGISSSIEGMSLAMYMAEMAMTLSPTGQEAQRELRLLLNCFYMISESKTDLREIAIRNRLREDGVEKAKKQALKKLREKCLNSMAWKLRRASRMVDRAISLEQLP